VLARRNPLPGDGKITFVEDGHVYTLYGEAIQRSTTRVLSEFFAVVDPVANTDTYYPSWKINTKHKYYPIIRDTLAAGGDDEAAKAAIRASWEQMGAEAALGTALHLHCEYDLNGEALQPSSEISKEISQFESFKSSAWVTSRGLQPVRTELCVGWREDGRSISAGQIDALYVDRDGLYYLFDFKRVAKNHKLNVKELGFRASRDAEPACGLGELAHLPDTHFQRYSLQTSIYNLMLLNLHGIDVGDRMYLLRMHADRAAYELVQCRDLRPEARVALQSEQDRLAAAPPPAAPQGSPSSGGALSEQRPRGRPPAGKVWASGGWVDRSRGQTAPSPATAVTVKVRPLGKRPRGKVWDPAAGCWVQRRGSFGTCAPPVAATPDENSGGNAVPPAQKRPRRARGG